MGRDLSMEGLAAMCPGLRPERPAGYWRGCPVYFRPGQLMPFGATICAVSLSGFGTAEQRPGGNGRVPST